MSTDDLRILKFGGTSVSSAERLLRVLEIIQSEGARRPVVVVVSAMGDSTDRLLEAADLAAEGRLAAAEAVVDALADVCTRAGLLAEDRLRADGANGDHPSVTPLVREHFAPLRQILYGVSLLKELTAQTRDLILAFGEGLSTHVVANLLTLAGSPAFQVDARDWVVTDASFGGALVDAAATRERIRALAAGWDAGIPVTMGFVGATPHGRTTTLGRNGSDYTATLLAWALGAAEVNVFSDVPGVMTADPAIVADAYPLDRMSYKEALELANYGAKMFHPRTMIPLMEAGAAMRIRSTQRPDEPGTMIDAAGSSDAARATSVTSLEGLALLGVEWRALAAQAQVGERVLAAVAHAGCTVWMENQAAHGQSMGLVVPAAQADAARGAIEEALERELRRGEVEPILVRQPVTLLTLVAEAMGRTSGVAGRFFGALGAVGVNILASVQGASSRSIAAVINHVDTPVAVRTVHAAFNFAHQKVSLLLLGKGTVGGHLIQQLRTQREILKRDHDLLLDVVGLADSRRAAFDPDGIPLDGWEEALAAAEPLDTAALLDRLAHLPVPILVDCTAADGMEVLYRAAFERGIHVVAANKKPITIDWSGREALMAVARRHHRDFRYETTVGASLPVIETLQDLVRTGDRVRLVEGSFSGTLGYLANEITAGVPLSEAVRIARELGYTEPNPQDDLSGLDVARKALILARELGHPVAMEEVEVEPLVPAALLEPMSLEAFFEQLALGDGAMADRLARLKEAGKVLKYLARIEPPRSPGGPCRVTAGPVEIPLDHPATRLRGSEAFVAFTTERYADSPLIVQGSGAGGAVTAAGVLADVLRVAQSLRGR
ncbi:MAG: bifunctional aspartate kinase/homoserine dehydrogenase I [Pseudomonadota bacterium]